MRVSIYTDGASKGNPGPSGAGALLRLGDGKEIQIVKGLGHQTNSVAEYEAMLIGLEVAIQLGGTHIRAYSDSELIIKQLKGEYKVKSPHLIPFWLKIMSLKQSATICEFAHIFREENTSADSLANQGVKLLPGQVWRSDEEE